MDLKTLCELNGASGDERAVRAAVLAAAKEACGDVRIDRMGSVIACKKGRGGHRHILFSAHMDEVGFLILDATEEGLLAFRPVGRVDPRAAVSKYVLVGEKKAPGVIGALAIHLQSAEDRRRVLGYDQLYIDIGAKSKDEALSDCPPGSYAYFDAGYREFGDGCVVSKALDGRAGCWNLLRLLEGAYDADVTCAFVTQEQVGARGSMAAAFASDADTAVILNGVPAGDLGDVDKTRRVCELGLGAAVSFMDPSAIGDPELYRELLSLGQRLSIPCQPARGVAGGGGAASFQRTGPGKRVCVLSVPCRYTHGPSAVARLSDIDAQYRLARAFAEQA